MVAEAGSLSVTVLSFGIVLLSIVFLYYVWRSEKIIKTLKSDSKVYNQQKIDIASYLEKTCEDEKEEEMQDIRDKVDQLEETIIKNSETNQLFIEQLTTNPNKILESELND